MFACGPMPTEPPFHFRGTTRQGSICLHFGGRTLFAFASQSARAEWNLLGSGRVYHLPLGLALRLFGETMQVARVVCECAVSLGVMLFSLGFRKLAGSWMGGAVATLLLLTPPVIFAANMVRMEAPLFLLIAFVLLLHVHGYFLAAGSLLAGSVLLHPALGIAAVGYIVIACLMPRKRSANRGAWAVAEWIIFCDGCHQHRI